jgi:hypothetical protein
LSTQISAAKTSLDRLLTDIGSPVEGNLIPVKTNILTRTQAPRSAADGPQDRASVTRYAEGSDEIKPQGFGASPPKTPQQAARFETPGSLEYEAAVAKGLDMSQAGRMARAKEMGFDTETVLYHGTPDSRGIMEEGFKTSKEKFGMKDPDRVYFFAENKKVADTYADDRRAFDYQGATAETIPVYLKSRNPKVVDWGGRPFRGKEKDGSGFSIRDYIDQARADGHDSVIIRNVIDTYDGKGKASTIRAVFDPSNIRSVNAAFDPEKSTSSTLLAAAPFAAVGGAGLTSERELGARMADDTIRADGTKKGTGFLGPLKRPDGMTMTEYSVGVNIDGKDVEIPTLVPTLTQDEIDSLLNLPDGDKPPRAIINKAIDHARNRIKNNKSPFWNPQDDGQPTPKKKD